MMKHHATQREYWRSLEHLAQTEEVRGLTEHEFSAYEPDGMLSMSSLTRRRFMKLMGASMAMAGLTLTGCRRWPQEKLAPYTSNPRNRIPGVPEQYATVMEIGGVATPLLVTAFDGRPIKIEGNPSHPWSQTVAGRIGAADAISQASILELYDPDRSRWVIDRTGGQDKQGSGESFGGAITLAMNGQMGNQGDGMAILSQAMSGPSAARLKASVLDRFPKAHWFEYEPLSRDNEMAGSILAFGKPVRQVLHLDQAQTVVLLDADPLGTHPGHVKYASDWASRRRSVDSGEMSQVFAAESAFSVSGSVADVRLPIRPSRIRAILAALAAPFKVNLGHSETLSADEHKFVVEASYALSANPGRSVLVLGSHLPPEMHAAALAVNLAMESVGSTLTLHDDPTGARPTHFEAISDLTRLARDGRISLLLILGGNPVYNAPADLDFADALKSVGTSIHLSLFDDETSKACKWHIPRAHYLESWSDARAWDGTISVTQPLITPLYDGKTPEQILAMLASDSDKESDAIVRKTFASLLPAIGFESAFRHALHDGLLPDSAWKTSSVALKPASTTMPATASSTTQPPSSEGTFQVRFLQDLKVHDGRFATNGWLQELPDPLTKVVWDNAALVSKKDADTLGVDYGDYLEIKVGERALKIPAYILPGQPIGVIGLPLGYGRTSAEHIGTGVGFNTYTLRTTAAPYFATHVKVTKGDGNYELATTQNHHIMDELGMSGRDERVGTEKHAGGEQIIRESTLDVYKDDPSVFRRNEDGTYSLQQLYNAPRQFNDPRAWGMAIDLNSCIGCQACVAACQAENNIPIVGKDQVIKNRQMHWIRIDRYFKGEANDPNPEVVFQPVTCQHCENAPCEQVCPVGATMHDTEGVNVMVYNRCIGTRYCSNNCPYKVRRFNYLDFHSQDPRHDKYPMPYPNIPDLQQNETVDAIKRMVFNPEVTVRMRGVMEKCTFCIQRIHTTEQRMRAAKEQGQIGKEYVDGDVITACQQSCPTQAIFFGDLNDPESQVSRMQKSNRAYELLGDFNTRPRNKYLGKVSNPYT